MFAKIIEKLEELKNLDTRFEVFGAEAHQYIFNPKLEEETITLFEEKHKIKLPENYRYFLLNIGNGGCGPGSGLLKLETGVYDIPFNKQNSEIITLKNEFRFTNFWNLEEFPKEDYDLWENEYDKIKWTDGMLRINHLGCGIYSNLIITGKERENIWIDSRSNEIGVYPAYDSNNNLKNDFLSWYLNWINYSINEFKTDKKT